MGSILLIVMGPFVIDILLVAGLAKAAGRLALAALAGGYLIFNVVGPLAYGFHAFPKARSDVGEGLSLVGLVLLARLIDLFALRLWSAFSMKWADSR